MGSLTILIFPQGLATETFLVWRVQFLALSYTTTSSETTTLSVSLLKDGKSSMLFFTSLSLFCHLHSLFFSRVWSVFAASTFIPVPKCLNTASFKIHTSSQVFKTMAGPTSTLGSLHLWSELGNMGILPSLALFLVLELSSEYPWYDPAVVVTIFILTVI